MNKIAKFFKKIGSAIYNFVDRIIVTPISTLVYKIQNKFGNNSKLEKILNRPHILLYLSLIFAIILFYLVDSKAIMITNTDVDILTEQPVRVIYNNSAYVVEGIPETVDITLMGKKSELYLARQFSDNEVVIDLTDYQESDKPVQVKITYNKQIDNLKYKIDPSYATVTIRKKVNAIKIIDYDLLNHDSLDEKLSVKDVKLTKTEVVVRGSQETLDKIASIKALIDLNDPKFTQKGTYTVDNLNLVAYSNDGEKINNVEIVATNISAKVELDSFSKNVPVKVITEGKLVDGKAISSIKINDIDASQFEMTIYGDEESLNNITSVPITIDINGQGNNGSKTSNVIVPKPSGIRALSDNTISVVMNYDEAKQRTITISEIVYRNVANDLVANSISDTTVDVQVTGVEEALNELEANLDRITAYIDLEDYSAGNYSVKVNIEDTDSRIKYEPMKNINILLSKKK